MKYKILTIVALIVSWAILILAGFGVAHLLEEEQECVRVVSALGHEDCLMIER